MTNRKKMIQNQQINQSKVNSNSSNNNNNNNNTPKCQTDDDNCSVICYKDSRDEHIGVIRIRQQPVCPACNIMRPTITAYYKHLIETTHRETVKKLCDENKYQPSIYDQVIHLAFANNLHYQSPKFHFLYKHADEDADVSMDIDKSTAINGRKRRNFEVSLVFQQKIYSHIGPATPQIREQLFKDLVKDRTDEIARLPKEIYYAQKKILQSQEKDQSSSENPTEDSITQDETLDCKLTIDSILRDVYSKSGEFQREQQFYSGIARRAFRKKNTFFCDICEKLILPLDKHFSQHFNDNKHVDNFRNYQNEFLPWRRAMQQSLITEQSVKDILGNDQYEQFKQTMATYLAPNTLSNRGRFCCGYCELIFTDQWTLEKHLHSNEHKEKQTSADHKELILNFANSITLPIIFKYNGVKSLSEVPEDIRIRYECRAVTRTQYDDDVNTFIRSYPFDTLEGATRLLSNRAARRQRANQAKTQVKNGRPKQTPTNHQRGPVVKRTFPHSAPTNKRFRSDLNSSYPGANRGPGLIGNYPRPMPYNNGQQNWPTRYPNDQHPQQRQEFFDRPNFSIQPDNNNNNNHNNGFYGSRPTHPMPNGNNYNRQMNYNEMNERTFNHHQQNFVRPMTQSVPPDYRQELPHNRAYPNNNFSQNPPVNQMNYQNPNPPFFQSPVNSSPMHSYADYRSSSALPTGNSHSSMYPPPPPPARTFDEFGHSSNSYNRQTFSQTSWHGGSSRDTNPNSNMNNRGRRGGGHGPNSFPTHKQATATFSYSSSSSSSSSNSNNNNNNNQQMSTRGRIFTNRY